MFPFIDGPGNSIQLSPNVSHLETTKGYSGRIIECSADCNPPCSYLWQRTGTFGANLTLNPVERTHIGEHICQAENMVINAKYEAIITFLLLVKCKLPTYIRSSSLSKLYPCYSMNWIIASINLLVPNLSSYFKIY